MLILQLRLTSHFLGELRPDHGGIRRFKKDKQGRAHVNQKFWNDQLALAARNLRLDVDVRETVVAPAAIVPASIHLYRRIYSQVNMELFESFRKGTILTFEMLVREDLPKCPSLDQLHDIFSFTGEYLGLSQFGSKFGFGRFFVESLNVADMEALLSRQLKPASPACEQTRPSPGDSGGDAPVCDAALKIASL